MLWEADRRGYALPTPARRTELIDEAHRSGHFGTGKTVQAILRDGYWWPGIHAQVRQQLQRCSQCMRYNVGRTSHHPLQSIEADHPWDHVQFDLIGPLPLDQGGWVYILVVVDVLTMFTRLYALRTKTEREVARRLWQCMCQMGVWKIGQSDNGTEFDNKTLRELSQMLGVDRRLISAYHARADGLVEGTVICVDKGTVN